MNFSLRAPLALLAFWLLALGGHAESGSMDRISLSVDRKVLNVVREPNVTGTLTLTGHYSDVTRKWRNSP